MCMYNIILSYNISNICMYIIYILCILKCITFSAEGYKLISFPLANEVTSDGRPHNTHIVFETDSGSLTDCAVFLFILLTQFTFSNFEISSNTYPCASIHFFTFSQLKPIGKIILFEMQKSFPWERSMYKV